MELAVTEPVASQPGGVDSQHAYPGANQAQRAYMMAAVDWQQADSGTAARMQTGLVAQTDRSGTAGLTLPMESGATGSDSRLQTGSDPSLKSLTLSYQGDQWVFEAVHPEKFHAIMRILAGPRTAGGAGKHSHDLPARMPQSQRLRSLARFREKRKERRYDKRIRYTVRKEVAQKMNRNKGQFASARVSEGGLENGGGDGEEGYMNGGGMERTCKHCGAAEGTTPMMRRGPDGPRTLCNACGLMWANKKKLRDLTKAANSCRGGSTPGRGRAATAMAAAQAAQQMEAQGGYLSSLQAGSGNPELSLLPVSQEGTSLGDGNPDNKVG
uniref:CCT domain-containing protein n=1 Tax=Pyramimonas obovata TaxID=1411642 RepID=A0A7S0WP61_9CHLO|mmetsp:Transcript_32457/g.70895  ORF Transcript_32457/g.70895 Transcript_32457/m.70895 type:complete len:326 (+) Transcript_32457:245-1222(+)